MLNSISVSKLCGVSLRRLQYYDEQGFIKPILRGHTRRYDDSQIAMIKRVAQLRERGIPLKRSLIIAKTNPDNRVQKLLQAIDLLGTYSLRFR